MSELHTHADPRPEMAVLLADCRRRVRWAGVRARVPVALNWGSETLLATAGAVFFLQLTNRVLGQTSLLGWRGFLVLALLAAGLPAVVVMVRAIRRQVSLTEAAERLDLGVQDHNRIAIALALSEDRDAGPFGMAAIRDGLDYLRRWYPHLPHVERAEMDWMGGLQRVAMAMGLMMVAGLISGGKPPGTVAEMPVPMGASAAVERSSSGQFLKTRELSRPAAPPVLAAVGKADRSGAAAPANRPGVKPRSEPAVGRPGGGARAEVNASSQSESTKGEASESQGAGKPKERRAPAPARKDRGRQSREPGSKASQAQEDASSISQGSSGGGGMSPVQNSASQRLETRGHEREDDEVDEPTEDEKSANTQRGGIQPTLKDRQAAPTRDLGISGEQGPPGGGRGGPTPPKKSRGTASLVLGVPIPDFVRGRLGPGVSKVTRERVEPAPMPGEPAVPVAAPPRSLPEDPSSRYRVPPAMAATVQRYLAALHSADQESSRGGDTPGPPASKPLQE
ncbi:MAG: hypothetical protein KA354_05840 [Phycisphaerae bacterium]|nr:hypothetical protein [Phycisphaerae bacterium]